MFEYMPFKFEKNIYFENEKIKLKILKKNILIYEIKKIFFMLAIEMNA